MSIYHFVSPEKYIYILCHNGWTNWGTDPVSTSKWPSEPQFCERYSCRWRKLARNGHKTTILVGRWGRLPIDDEYAALLRRRLNLWYRGCNQEVPSLNSVWAVFKWFSFKPASGWDKVPLSAMVYGVLFLSSISTCVYVWHASVDILSGQLVAAQDPDFSINSLGVKKSYVNPSQLLSLGGVWRLSTLPAGHDVYVLPYAIKWCGLSIVNCFRRWILFFAIFWFSLRENHNKMNEHLLFWKHLCAYINVSWHWLARTSLQWAVFFLLFKST